MEKLRVLLVDDHTVVRHGLRRILASDEQIEIVGEAGDGRAAVEVAQRVQPHVVVMDVALPELNGIEATRQLAKRAPNVHVLMLTMHADDVYVRQALKAGASGYLSKDSAPEELMKAVTQVLAGKRYVSNSLAELLVAELDTDHDKPLHAELSEREFQIFCKLAAGQSVSDIASELSLSVKTVSTYRTRVLEKMCFKSNADITSYALRNGLMN